MILKFILYFFTGIIEVIMYVVGQYMPTINIATQLFQYITQILSITQQALNFMYLILGDTLFLVMPLIISLLTFKYIAYPILQVIRSLIINSNE